MTIERKATLSIDGLAPVDFSIMAPVHGNDCVDIRTLGAKTGLFTYDSGFLSTASCKSKITFIDGDVGQLLYRGYPIEQLAENCNFLEVTYLLKNGDLPNAEQKAAFEKSISQHTMVHEQLSKFFSGFRRDAHPMAVMTGVVGALSAFYHDAVDFSDQETRDKSFVMLIAKMPTIVAMAYKYNIGMPFMHPDNELGYTANFMRMMFGNPCEKYVPNPVLVRALDTIFTLHADHEQNASSPVCGARRTVVPMKPVCRCLKKSATSRAFPNSSRAPRTRTIRSSSWASVTASTRTSTRVPRSCARSATKC